MTDLYPSRLDPVRYVTGQRDGSLVVRDSSTGRATPLKFKGKTKNRVPITAVSLSADEGTLFAGRVDGELIIVVVCSGQVEGVFFLVTSLRFD